MTAPIHPYSINPYLGQLPPDAECPITQESPEKPVLTGCGHLFSGDALKQWLFSHETCPVCIQLLDSSTLFTPKEKAIKTTIRVTKTCIQWIQRHPIIFLGGCLGIEVVFQQFSGGISTGCYFLGDCPSENRASF